MTAATCLGLMAILGPWENAWTVEVTAPQQSPFITKLVGFGADSVEFSGVTGTTQRTTSSLLKLTFVENSPVSRTARNYSLRLVDGSSIQCNSLTSNGQLLKIDCEGQPLRISSRFALALQLRDLDKEQQTAFDAISGSAINADTLIVLQDGSSISRIEGIVNSIGPDSVDFEFSGTSVAVPFSKLAGIRFYAGSEPARPTLKAVVRDIWGNEWYATGLVSSGQAQVNIDLQCGASIQLPIGALASIDFSYGSTKYLADLEPVRRSSNRTFNFAIDLPLDQLLGPTLQEPVNIPGKAIGPSLRFVGSGEATYRIPDGFTRFLGSAELRPTGSKYTPCRVQVFLESQLLWDELLGQTGIPIDFDLEVQGDQRLRLVVSANSRLPTGDVVVWREPRLLK